MKTSIKIKNGLSDIAAIVAREFRIISTSYAILLVLIGGIFIYGFLYNYMYEPNLIRNAPVAVVDRSHSALSRQYTRLIDAAPQVSVYTTEPDFPGAKELLKKGEVIGIIYIPTTSRGVSTGAGRRSSSCTGLPMHSSIIWQCRKHRPGP